MRKKKIPMRKCIISNEMRPKKDMIRVVIKKKAKSLQMRQEKQGRGAYVSKDVALVEKGSTKRSFRKNILTLLKIHLILFIKEIIRLIYREEIPK